MTDRAAFLNGLVSRPYAREGAHCWSLVVEVQRALFGRELPPVSLVAPSDARSLAQHFAYHPERERWREVADAEDGAVVLMSRTASRHARDIHAGVYLVCDGRGLVWHADAPHGVEAVSLAELRLVRRFEPRFFVPK